MRILGIRYIKKLKKKNKGNLKLTKAIDELIGELQNAKWKNKQEVLAEMNNRADCVHNDGFYFFDINIHRTMVLIEYCEPEINKDGEETISEGIAEILWVGSHNEYIRIFKNNKNSINVWLKSRGLIE